MRQDLNDLIIRIAPFGKAPALTRHYRELMEAVGGDKAMARELLSDTESEFKNELGVLLTSTN